MKTPAYELRNEREPYGRSPQRAGVRGKQKTDEQSWGEGKRRQAGPQSSEEPLQSLNSASKIRFILKRLALAVVCWIKSGQES